VHHVSACVTFQSFFYFLLIHVPHVFTPSCSYNDGFSPTVGSVTACLPCKCNEPTACTFITVFYNAPISYLRASPHMLQARQYIILSVTVSHRNHDIDPNFLIAVLSVLVRYTTGVFSETISAVTEGSPTRLWAAVSLERGLTNNRLHVQGACLVCFN
jgi:hypothetical protein